MRPIISSSRRNYNRIVANQDDTAASATAPNALAEPLSPSTSFADGDENCGSRNALSADLVGNQPISSSTSTTTTTTAASTLPPLLTPNIENEIHVTLMDGAQTKFNITCDAQWTVSEFKEVSSYVTKVPPRSQRLIHMGKLLQDSLTLGECGINEDGKIIHLFPKPNVVITNSNCEEGQSNNNNSDSDGSAQNTAADNTTGAHIPQIILDSEEASRRSQILILSSQEIFEAQHRVKLFSFLLMIISSMELLTLMTLYVGVPQEGDYPGYGPGGGGPGGSDSLPPGNPTDTPPSSSYGNAPMEMRTWQNSDYFDTLISAFGFYVSLLGIQATTENTNQLAKRYLSCLVLAAVGSNCYYYYLNVLAQERHAQDRNLPIDKYQLYTTSFVGILLPLTVWMLCILRAYQFQALIREAEIEAEERTRASYPGEEGTSNNNDNGNNSETSRTLQYGSEDLELTVERGVST
ncbi:hypothetical protein ACHAWU_010164 [Discostella pseudostelligera]|uniref:Ubiquitin-like domain-containing protein n=1 Tax=Discostella pseudostelligera TaxID=259834 RepID=A0ABD3M1Q8_9STRA